MNDARVGKKIGSSGKGSAPDVITPPPRAVVVDTNLWGNGILDVGRLKGHAKRLAGSRIEVWIPTQVLWEWASHAVKDAKLAAPMWNRLKRAGLVEGKFPGTSDVEAVLKTLKESVDDVPNVVLVPVSGEAAIAGLRDQVLGTGPGTLRDGVKTGAVDSSLVRDAIANAGGDPGTILFVTNNAKDVHETAKAMGVRVHVRSEDSMYSSLFPAVAEPEQLVQVIADELGDLLDPNPEEYPPYLMETLLPVADIEVSRSAFDPPDHFELTATSLSYGASVVAITDVDVVDGLVHGAPADGPSESPSYASSEASAGSPANHRVKGAGSEPPSWTVEFTVVLLADVDAVGYQLDNDGSVATSAGVIGDTVVLAPMVADIVDRSVSSMTANGSARAEKSNPTFPDPDEALAWLLAELGAFHGVRLEDDDTSLKEFTFHGPKDVTVTATLTGVDDWKLAFDLGDDDADAVISCHYDPGARVWAGRDSFDIRGPYYLVSGEGDVTGANPYYVLTDVWRCLNGL